MKLFLCVVLVLSLLVVTTEGHGWYGWLSSEGNDGNGNSLAEDAASEGLEEWVELMGYKPDRRGSTGRQ